MARPRNPDLLPSRPRALGAAKAIMVLVIALLLAGVVGMSAFAGVMRTRMPALIPALLHDPVAPMAAWTDIIMANPARLKDVRTRDVSIATLNTQPLNAPALRLLAAWEDTQGHSARANRLAHLSEKVTRRDLLTQLFLLERAVSRDDVDGALTHYDKALRVSPNSKQLLFPVLIAAMEQAPIRDSLAIYAERQAPWIGGFLFSALDAQDGVIPTAELLLNPRVPADSPLLASLSANLVGRLLNQQEFSLAERIFNKLPATRPDLLTDLSFSTETTSPAFGPLSWQITDDTDADIAFQRATGGKQSLYISIPKGGSQSRNLVRRIIHLSPGEYRFGERRTADASSNAPFWQIECVASSGEWVALWRSTTETASRSPLLRVPPNCGWQRISLITTDIGTTDEVETTIDGITLHPIRVDLTRQPVT